MSVYLRLILLIAATVPAFGQAVNGSISGIVTDASGATIPDAKITVTDLDRNTAFSTASNETGFYLVSQLPIGRYRINALKSGFRPYVVEGFPLQADQRASVNVTMEVGVASAEVMISAAPQLFESTTSTLGAVVSNDRIVDLPLNNRNIYSLTSLLPGVFQTKTTSGVDDTFYGNHFIINGSQEATSDMVLDGVSLEVNHNVPTIPSISAIPSVESIQEFKILTNSFSAEYGRSGGGVVIMATKSGTNTLHGSAFEFLRNSALDSNDWFANRSGTTLASFKRSQFGGSLGGPVFLPKIYNGKSKTFFFVDYEGLRLRKASIGTFTLPTALQRQGDFSKTLNASGQMMVIYNPLSTSQDAAGNYSRQPFANNSIPTGMLNPIALNMQKYYPQPNNPGLAFTGQNNYVVQSAYPQWSNRVDSKIDHYFNAATRIMGRYGIHDSLVSDPNYYGNIANPGCCEPLYQRLQSGIVDLTHTLGSNKVLELRAGVGRVAANRVPYSASMSGVGGFDPTALGFPASIAANANQLMFPTVTIQDTSQIGPNGGNTYHMWDMAYTVNGSMSWVVGRHTIKFGGDGRVNLVNYGRATTPVGQYNFYRSMTAGPNPFSAASTSGIGYASFLLGTGGGISNIGGSGSMTDEANPANANRYYALYVQDDFRVSSKLTLNAGLRWDVETGSTERYNRQTWIDPYVRSPLSDKVGMNLYGGTLFNTPDNRAIVSAPLHNFGPRVGLAYQLNAKTVLRSAYGIYYTAAPYGASRHNLGEGFSTSTPWVSTLDGATPNYLLSNPFPDGFNHYTGTSQGLLTQLGATLNDAYPAALKTPYNQQWNFTVQRQFSSSMVWEVAYAGNKSTHLPIFQPYAPELDQMDPSLLSLGSQLLTQVANPFYGIITTPGSILAQKTVQRGQLLRPYPQYTGFQMKNAAWGNSYYHALQTRFERRLSKGASFMASYTYSKTISGAVDGLWTQAGQVRNWYCVACEKAVSSYDQPQRLVINGSYELPIGRGHMLAGSANRLVNALIGGWQMNGVFTLAVGLPLYNWGESTSTCFCFGGLQRPDYNGLPASLGDAQSVNKWFNTAAFVAAQPYTFGNLARVVSAVRRDGAHNLDFSVAKNFKPREGMTVAFRAEAYNLTNSPLFGAPNVTQGSASFGVVSSQENTPRQIQAGLKILF
jgi:hypothetical protein